MRLVNMRLLGAVAAAGLMTVAAPAPAPADLGLNVIPTKIELATSADKTETVPVTVRNNGDAPVHVQASLTDFTTAASGQYVFLASGKNPYSLGPWMTVNPREFDIPPGQFQQVRVSFTVPAAKAGEYSSIVFFQTRPSRRPGSIGFSERIASKVYALVGETGRIGGEVDDVAAQNAPGAEKYVVGFKNVGNVHVYVSGKIEIRKAGSVVDKVVVGNGQLVERGSRVVLEASGRGLSPGTYDAVAMLDYGGPKLTAGQATFTVH